MVGVIPGQAEQLFIGIFTKFAQSTKGAWEITEPFYNESHSLISNAKRSIPHSITGY